MSIRSSFDPSTSSGQAGSVAAPYSIRGRTDIGFLQGILLSSLRGEPVERGIILSSVRGELVERGILFLPFVVSLSNEEILLLPFVVSLSNEEVLFLPFVVSLSNHERRLAEIFRTSPKRGLAMQQPHILC